MNVMTIVTWILRLIVAAAFLAAAAMKLTSQPMMVDEFNQLGMGPYFIYVTGMCEVIGALAVLYPPTTPLGCLWLLCVMVGAFIANMTLHHDVLHVFGFVIVLAVLLFLTRHHMMRMVGRGGETA